MKFILLALLLTTVACNKEEVIKFANEASETPAPTPEPEVEVSITDQIVERLQGTYTACVASTMYPGYYNNLSVTVTDKDYVYWFELSAAANCSSPLYRFNHYYEIEEASYTNVGDDETIDITLKTESLNLAFHHPWYVGNNYCGLGWVLGVEMDLTGVSCVSDIAPTDTNHSRFRILGDLEFHRFVLSGTTLTIPFGYHESGDAASERKVSSPTALTKQ